MFGGLAPIEWAFGSPSPNGGAPISSNKDVLLTLFSQKGFAGKNAMVHAEEWNSISNLETKHALAMFRIENTTGNTIDWDVFWRGTSTISGAGGTNAVVLNGINIFAPDNANSNSLNNTLLTIPANRISTIIFIAGSARGSSSTHSLMLAFQNNSLELPAGLRYVDDLDTAANGWDN